MAKRSPRYPRVGLDKAIEMTRKLFDGAHQSRVDVDTAAKVIGYSSSTGGAAASAIGALRQYGLVDGLRGDVAVSDLAMRILQPLNDLERFAAVQEAAGNPEIFGRVVSNFGGKLPASDEPIRAYLIRNEGFSTGGANDLIAALRGTLELLPSVQDVREATQIEAQPEGGSSPVAAKTPSAAAPPANDVAGSGLISLPLGSSCRAELRFVGEVTATSYDRLVKHLQLLRDMLAEEDEADWED